MTGILKQFKRQSLPTSQATGVGKVVMNKGNAAVERILEEEQDGDSGQKCKYTHFLPKQTAKVAKETTECGNTPTM